MEITSKLLILIFCTVITAKKEHSLECEISVDHHVSKSCSVVTSTCTILGLHGIDNDTTLVFTNANEKNFTKVIFEDSSLPVLDKSIADQFPVMDILRIEGAGVTLIDDFAFENAKVLRELNLKANSIRKLTYSTFAGASNLRHLDLSRNELKEIPPEVFHLNFKLETLNFRRNKLTVLSGRTFSMLTNLKSIQLGSNPLVEINPVVFADNKQLKRIELKSIEVEELYLQVPSQEIDLIELKWGHLKRMSLSSPKWTTSPITIQHLGLNANKFDHIKNIHIDNNIIVKKLELYGNEFKELDSDAPEFLQSVTQLKLGGEQLKRVTSKFTRNLGSLEELKLTDCEVPLLPNLFQNLKKLKKLDLDGNKMGTINVEAFNGLTSLEHISLGYTQISELDYKSLAKTLPSLRVIDLDENLFTCDFLREMDEYLEKNTSVRIHKPMETESHTYGFYKQYYGITCDKSTWFVHIHWIGIVVISLVTTITAIILNKRQIQSWWSQKTYGVMPGNLSGTNFQTTENGVET